MKQNMTLIDLTNKEVFPNTDYRFSRIRKTEDALILERDFIGENPMHYYLDSKEQEVIVANSIKDIKTYLEENGKPFLWEHVRAVSNNKRAVINSQAFYTATPEILELMTPLQNMSSPNIDFSDMDEIGNYLPPLVKRIVLTAYSTSPTGNSQTLWDLWVGKKRALFDKSKQRS